jgi:hypothetical protein
MSRAFVNEDAGQDRPEHPVPPGRNLVTARGLAALRSRLADRTWKRPSRDLGLEIIRIAHADP